VSEVDCAVDGVERPPLGRVVGFDVLLLADEGDPRST